MKSLTARAYEVAMRQLRVVRMGGRKRLDQLKYKYSSTERALSQT
jgi:hypothetical protein